MKGADLMKKISSNPKRFFILIAILAMTIGGVQITMSRAQRAGSVGFQGDTGIIFLSAALAVGLSGIGSGIAVSFATSAGSAALVEKPELSGIIIILAGLAEGIAIYGFIIAILILGKVG